LEGTLILREAGGMITDVSNESLAGLPVTATGIPIVAAANERVHRRIIERLG
jgi:fructose-1,6-bisphosphatase/inositol monophosphatase family enzyme